MKSIKKFFTLILTLVMLVNCFIVQSFAADVSITNCKVINTGNTARFEATLLNPAKKKVKEVGLYLGTSKNNLKKVGSDTKIFVQKELPFYYDDIKLKSDNTYYYQFYCKINATHIVLTPVKSFKTKTVSKEENVKKASFSKGVYTISNNYSGLFMNTYKNGYVATTTPDASAEQQFQLTGTKDNYKLTVQGYGGRNIGLSGNTLMSGNSTGFCFVNRGNGYSIHPTNDMSKALTETSKAYYGGDRIVEIQAYTGSKNQLWTLSVQKKAEATAPFQERHTAPMYGVGYYYNAFPYSNGNCTWYSYSRAWEIMGQRPVFNGNAADWWAYRNAYAGCSTDVRAPRQGAIIVWGGNGTNPYGHVAVVEAVSDWGVTITESSYGGVWYTGTDWGRRTLSYAEVQCLHGQPFVGYIYLR